ncbi:MAG: L-threonylcarbamoyladenylate synthase [Clostridiales bacterium]
MVIDTQIIDVCNRHTAVATAGIALGGAYIREGKLTAFPTETVYGLGADALNPGAVAAIFAAKGRAADNPLISHIADFDWAERLAYFSPLAQKLAEKFWPGPLTLVLRKKMLIPDIVCAGLPTAGLRFPAHPVALALIRAAGTPIAAPSANTSGRPSPTLAAHVYEDLAGKLPLILDGGPVEIGLESTVVDASGEIPLLLRPGKITVEQLLEIAGDVAYPTPGASLRPAAPGMKYTHYAPMGRVQLADDCAAVIGLRQQIVAASGKEPLLIVFGDTAAAMGQGDCFIIAQRGDMESFARNIFAAFRLADQQKRRDIVVETVPEQGLGLAIMNRLRKSAGIGAK